MSETKQNPLGYRSIPRLLFSLAVPAVIANLVNSLYNIVDQIFIGHGVGYLGNAATSIAFPLTTVCLAIGLMCGLGGAANFNLELGRQDAQKAKRIAGTAVTMMVSCGIIICLVVNLFLKPLLILFGATDQTFDYAYAYTQITSFGIPFLLFSIGFNPLVRADGSSLYSMMAVVSGAVLNTLLDPLFIFGFDMGIEGAAYATVLSQMVSAAILLIYFRKFRSVRFALSDFLPKPKLILAILSVGLSSFIFQSSTVVIQIVTNNQLKTYGALSVYGSDIPIAIAGIVAKISAIFVAVIIGIVQGSQPICGYNYGAKQYDRVRQTIQLVLATALSFSLVAFILFECFPRQLIALFGSGSDLYFTFGAKYLRVFLFFTFLNGVQIASTTFFQAIGKATKGAFLSLIKQVLFLLPLLLILPRFMGVEGLMFAAPISDLIAFCTALAMLTMELRSMPRK